MTYLPLFLALFIALECYAEESNISAMSGINKAPETTQESGDYQNDTTNSAKPLSKEEEETDSNFFNALGSVRDAHKRHSGSVPKASDAQEASEVHEFITTAKSLPGKCYSRPTLGGTLLIFYEVRDPLSQESIVRLLTDKREKESWKPILVLFKDSENMQIHESEDGGGSVHVRHAETILRKVFIPDRAKSGR